MPALPVMPYFTHASLRARSRRTPPRAPGRLNGCARRFRDTSRRVVWIVGLQALPAMVFLTGEGMAQPVPEPSPVGGTYSSFTIMSHVPGSWAERPEVMVAWGRLLAPGSQGQWLLRGDAVGGLVAGPFFLDGVLAGPQVSVAYVFAGDYLQVASRTFAEFYPVVGGSAYAYGFWRADPGDPPTGFHFIPSVFAGAGFRVYERRTVDPGLSTVDIGYEVRFGYGAPRLLIRLSRHRPLRARR